MSFDARITRRSALVLAASLLLAGCAPAATDGSAPAGSDAGSASVAGNPSTAWEVVLDSDAPFLNVEGEEGAAMPGDCWLQREDGSIQVQVAGSSIPEPSVERVEYADGQLTLVMAIPDENTPATMDYVLHQFVVTPANGDEVSGVKVVRGEDEAELPHGIVAADAISSE